MHFTVHVKTEEPAINLSKYYPKNFSHIIKLLDQMTECVVKYFIFSPASVYGNSAGHFRLTKDVPPGQINPYGRSELMIGNVLLDYKKNYGIKYKISRFFNTPGGGDNGDTGESYNPETHLSPLVLKATKISGTDCNAHY